MLGLMAHVGFAASVLALQVPVLALQEPVLASASDVALPRLASSVALTPVLRAQWVLAGSALMMLAVALALLAPSSESVNRV